MNAVGRIEPAPSASPTPRSLAAVTSELRELGWRKVRSPGPLPMPVVALFTRGSGRDLGCLTFTGGVFSVSYLSLSKSFVLKEAAR